MANPEQLTKLLDSVQAWNEWRTGRTVHVDLSGADLERKDLTRCRFA